MTKEKQKNSAEQIQKMAYGKAVFSWMAPSFLRFDRGWLWFVNLFVICGALTAYGYFTDSLTMIMVFAIVPFILLLEHQKKPKVNEVQISEYGIRFGKILIPFSNVKRFWIIHNPPFVDELHLLTGSRSNPEIVIQLVGTDPVRLRQFLVTQAYEWEGKHLSFLDVLIRILRLN